MQLPSNTNISGYLSRVVGPAAIGVVLACAGCMTGAPEDQVQPQATSSQLGIGPGPGIVPAPTTTPTPTEPAGSPSTLLETITSVVPGTTPCASDDDCRVESDYCADCSCLALGAHQKMGECSGEKITCILDPCEQHVARCIAGHCKAESEGIR